MKILHTSDWHLGRSLYGKKRYEEYEAFLHWLVQTIEKENIDVLLVAGDVFDTSTPGNRAQGLYYQLLSRVADSCCRHVVIIAGNHDSPSFLGAPKELLKAFHVHVVSQVSENLEDEVLVLNHNGTPEAIVCAVPYLRDKDIRTMEAGETIDDKNIKLVQGIKEHYAKVCRIARQKKTVCQRAGHGHIPIIVMGHLFTTGGKTVDGDGVRELYVGSLAHVGKDIFPEDIDYLALGHLHVPQTVGHTDHFRYCGSPIPLGFGEAGQEKKVVCIEFVPNTRSVIKEIPVPCFQKLVSIAGNWDDIDARLASLKEEQSSAWLEIEYTGREILPNLREKCEEVVAHSHMEIRRIKNRRVMERVMESIPDETLDDLDAQEVFTRCLDASDIPEEDRAELMFSYNEILTALYEEDPQGKERSFV